MALFAVLLAATVLLGTRDRFEVVGEDLLSGAGLTAAAPWKVRAVGAETSFQSGSFRVQLTPPCPNGWCRAQAMQPVQASGPGYARAEANYRWRGVVRGADPRHRGPRLNLGSRAPGGPWRWHQAFHVPELDGDGAQRMAQSYYVDTSLPEWGLWVDLTGLDGELDVTDISLKRLRMRPEWSAAFATLVGAWTAVILAALWPSLRRARRSLAHAGVVVATISLLAGTLAPEEHVNPLRTAILRSLSAASEAVHASAQAPVEGAPEVEVEAPQQMSSFGLDKTGHFLGFALLALSSIAAWGAPTRVLALLVPLTLVSESLQFLTLQRTPRWLDVGVDTAGIALGALLWWAYLRVRSRSTRN